MSSTAEEQVNEDEMRRRRLERVLSRLSRIQDSRPSYGAPPSQQQSLYDWAPTNETEDQDDTDQSASRRRQSYRRHGSLRSAAIMHNARTNVHDTRDNQDARTVYRRTYLAENPSPDPSLSCPLRPSPLLVSAIQYLDHLPSSTSYDESLACALDHGLFSPENYDDLVTNPQTCPRPTPSSWLAPSAIFRGSQHTTTSTTKDVRHSLNQPPAFDATRPWLSHSPVPPVPTLPAREVQDRWPVKVTIQAVDYERMTMAGTMEAFDVPNSMCSPTSPGIPKPTAPITTYLEGQIVDMDIHTFLTPTSPSQSPDIVFPPTSARTDAAYWRNLPPFNQFKSDQEVAHALLSQSRLEDIMSEWIFMRWKERCFIHGKSDPCHRNDEHAPTGPGMTYGEGDDTDTGHGLTISGFYYVSLRRSDGDINGLYFDTKTSPYQHLKLEASNKGKFGAWQFK